MEKVMLVGTNLCLFRRRVVWWPTRFLGICLFIFTCALSLCWWFCAESFLSLTNKVPPQVLVVEGWIGSEGFKSAMDEFQQGGYHHLVTVGGLPLARFGQQANYAEIAARELIRLGVPSDQVIIAPARNAARQRTFESAAAAWRAIHARSVKVTTINVFTMGAHARRSRAVYSKVFGPEIEVGVIAWRPFDYATGPWWDSSERMKDLITESIAGIAEVLFSSGRRSDGANDPAVLSVH